MYGLKETLINEIVTLATENNISELYLHGSRARGDFKPKSDIDLAIKGGNVLNFIFDIDEKTNTLLTFDIADLDNTYSKAFLDEINKNKVNLYEKA
jgi:predicted nucleotidyltransferase